MIKIISMLFFKLLLILSTFKVMAVETCSRVAIINYQEVLVDTNSTQKGEGLRFHLEKDPKARDYLNKYQSETKIKWKNAILGTMGTGLLISGLVTTGSSRRRQSLLIGGATLIAINFLVAKTLENANELNLLKSIEEYNKRNLPKIYFSIDKYGPKKNKLEKEIYLEKSWGF